MTELKVADFITTHPILFKPHKDIEFGDVVHMSQDVTTPFSYVSLKLIEKFGHKVSLRGDKYQTSFLRHQKVVPTRLALSETDGGVLSFQTFYELAKRNKQPSKELSHMNIIMMRDEKGSTLSDMLCLEWSDHCLMWSLYMCTEQLFLDCSEKNMYRVFLMRV
jgi:hypothetical protein